LADTAIAITAGSGTNVDTRTEGTNGNHRQVVVIGDPATNAGVAPVDVTNGLSVTLTTAIPAGSAAIGKLAANSGVDIGDVDVASIAAGTNVIGKVRLVDSAGDECTDSTANAAKVLLVNAAGTALTADTQGQQDTALGTITSVTGSMALARASTAVPSAVSAADDAVLVWANLNGAVMTSPVPHTVGGCTIFRSIDLDETEEEVKATAGQVYGGLITNTATATRWIKFYNATTANVTVGTTTPVITWGIPGNATDDIGAAFNNGGMGVAFDTAITVAATTGVADNDTGAPGANDVIVNLFYK
jgi:hypothetical protein